MKLEFIFMLFMFIMFALFMFVSVQEENNIKKEYITKKNLTYAYYNITTSKAKYVDSGIPIYELKEKFINN